jgi:hypothetical protein
VDRQVTYRRPIDESATKEARERQEDCEFALQLLFGLPYEVRRARKFNLSMHHSLTGLVLDCAPWKTNPNCPRPRSSGEKSRHLKRKRARAARRCNR